MEWITVVGYKMFPWVQNEAASSFQNMMHILVTILVVVFSIVSLVLIKSVFGLFERFSTFSAVVFNAVLGVYLLKGELSTDGQSERSDK